MKVLVLTTPGCTNCHVLENMLDELGVKYTVIDVTQQPEILEKFPIFTAPALIIEDRLEFIGIPKKEELEKKFR